MPNKTTAVCAARTNALVCNIHELITELEERIEDGEPFDNPKLTRTAERVFGGSRAQGRYTPRDAYDAVEIAVNNHLLEKHAAELMQMDVTEALASVLRPLMQRLPRQSDRTLEQTELQQFSTPPTLAYLAARLLESEADRYCLRAISRNRKPRDLASRSWRTSYLQRDKPAAKLIASLCPQLRCASA